MNINLKRTYDAPEADIEHRVLVNRLWPQCIKKENLHADEWAKTIALLLVQKRIQPQSRHFIALMSTLYS